MNGVLNILKPAGVTSFDIVRKLKKILSIEKIGHTGTLDPGAAGVLPLCVGKATKISDYLMANEKTYRFEIVFGTETDTHDAYGQIVSVTDVFPSEYQLKNVLVNFLGPILQEAPVFSAIKVQGNKLYDLARKGIEVEAPVREIIIKNLELLSFVPNKKAFLEVKCSKGTYIRSLCRDIASECGSKAFMGVLIRCSSGQFNIQDSITLEELDLHSKNGTISKILIPIQDVLSDLETVYCSDLYYKKLTNGATITLDNSLTGGNANTKVKVVCADVFIGIGEIIDSYSLKMEKILI